jgi:histone deacetylase 1/2
MGSSSAAATMINSSMLNPLMGITITEKLGKANHAMWKSQVLAAVRGSRLVDHLTGASPVPEEQIAVKGNDGKEALVPNPEFEEWYFRDQQVLSFVLGSLGREVLAQVAAQDTAAKLWAAIEGMYASQNRARVMNTRLALATAQKGSQTITEYVGKMRTLGDEMAAAGKKIEDDELLTYILTSLDMEFNPVVTSLLARKETVTVSEAYSQLLAFETRMEIMGSGQSGSSANMANRGGRGGSGRGRGNSGRGRGQGRGGRNPGYSNNFNQRQNAGGTGRSNQGRSNTGNAKPTCQVRLKTGHTADKCWHMFEEDYVPEERHASAAMNSYTVDNNWYTDTGATDHITGELEKLAVRDKYNGADQVHTANGAGMNIRHIGQSTIRTPDKDLELRNILHVPSTKKNLIFVHRLASDNNVYLEFHPDFFLIKDRDTRSTLLRGACRRGMYPLPSTPASSKQACGVNKVPLDRWHHRLGHPSFRIVERVLRDYKLPCSFDLNKDAVCDACQKAKSHRLPYPISTSVSSHPLELIFSDIWGPAPESAGRHKYYVSFVDDYSKFTWVYLLKHKSQVFEKFREFQNLVERTFDRKIIAVQTDWGGEYEKLNPFFTKIGISHLVSCPHAHQQNGAAERKHRHIVEVGLSLLAHAHMPLKFWDESFLAATYLINRTPNKVINFETPIERLYRVRPDYTSLRVCVLAKSSAL